VIAGYTNPRGQRIGFGAILIGFQDNGDFRYAGKVGTGFDDETLRWLKKKFRARRRKTSPFSEDVDIDDAHWIRPELVAEVGFTEWTDDDKLNHPRFMGLREDKKASHVVKEA